MYRQYYLLPAPKHTSKLIISYFPGATGFPYYAPFDSCPIPSLKIDAVFRGKLSSNSSSNLEIAAVGENEKPIRKYERRKDLEIICHSELNNVCNMIVQQQQQQQQHLIHSCTAYIHLNMEKKN